MAYIPFLNNAYFSAKVGIGTDSPSKQLEILYPSYINKDTVEGLLRLTGQSNTENAGDIPSAGVGIEFYNKWQGGLPYSIGRISARGSQSYDGGLQFDVAQNSAPGQSNFTTAMTILDSGNVGIGETNPSEKLEVAGTIKSISTGAAHLILNGDTNNSGDSGQVDAIIDFLGDGDPGIYGYRINTENYSGQTALNFQEYLNGTYSSRLYIDKDGNVGIGTTSPDYKFEVQGVISSADASLQKATFANVGNDLVLTANADATNVTAKMLFNSSGAGGGTVSTKMIIDGTGNVGIGTISPGNYKLNVAGTGYYSNQLTVDGFTNNAGISFRDGLDPTNTGIRAKAIGTANRDGVEVLGYNGIDLTVNNGANVAMRIVGVTGSGMGNVGIGTTSPDSLLEISKAQASGPILKLKEPTAVNGTLEGGPGNNLGVLGFVSSDTSTSQGNLIRASVEGQPGEKPYGTGGMLTFNTMQTYSGSGTLTDLIERMRITSTGNVGIGTYDPDSKLHVLQSGNGTSSLIITEDNARKIKIGRDSIQCTDLSDSGTNLYLNQGGGNVSIPNSGLVVGATGITYKFEVHSGATNVTSMFKSTDNQAWISIQDDDSGTYGALIGTDSDEGENFVVANASVTKMLSLSSAGSFKLHNYNSSNQTGTPTYILGTDASGNVVKTLSFDPPTGTTQFFNQSSLYNNTTPGITGYGDISMDTSVSYYDTGINVGNLSRGIVWTGKHYIITDYGNDNAKFFDNNFIAIPNPEAHTITLPDVGTISNAHGAGWDGRYLYCIVYAPATIVVYDLDNGTTTATIVNTQAMSNTTDTYDIEYAEGHLYTCADGKVSKYKVEGKTITHVFTSANILTGIEAQAITYDGSYLWITQNGNYAYKVSLDCVLVATITTGLPSKNVGWAWNGQNIAAVDHTTGDINIINTAATRFDTEEFLVMGGNVGIGTTSPAYKLQVGDNGVADGNIAMKANGTGADAGAELTFNMNVGGGNADSYIAQIVPIAYDSLSSGTHASLNFKVGAWNNNADAGVSRMTILSNGKVGIGTTDPSELLHLESTEPLIRLDDTNSGLHYIFGQDGDGFKFTTNNTTYGKYTFDSNVGIGVTGPQSKLQVAGGIQMADDTDTASATKVGTMRYRTATDEPVPITGTDLVTNGDLASSTGWNFQNSASINNTTGVATVPAGSTYSGAISATGGNWSLYQNNVMAPSKTYMLRFQARRDAGPDANMYAGWAYQVAFSQTVTAAWVQYQVVFTTGTQTWNELTFGGVTGTTFEVKDIAVVEVTLEDASYADMCMQTGASTYEWVNIVRNTY